MPRAILRLVCLGAVLAGSSGRIGSAGSQSAASDPFAVLAPSTVVSIEERARLDRGEVLARTLPGPRGQVAIFVATRLDAAPDALVTWTRAIAELKRSRFVLAIGRFSDPPRASDLDALTLDERDLEAVRRCRPGDCGLKLSATEIHALAGAAATAGDDWRVAVQREFRAQVLARVLRYRAGGLAAQLPPADGRRTSPPGDVLRGIVDASPYLARMPAVAGWLQRYPDANSGVESLFYWSKEQYGDGKPVVSVTHVGIVRPGPDPRLPVILVAGKQIFATHYLEGGLGVTMIVRDEQTGVRYLAYVNRSQVDLLRGFFGGLIRHGLEARLKRQSPLIVRGLRARLESGAPPESSGASFATSPGSNGVNRWAR